MSDLGDLGLLPLELRKEIYTYVLVEQKQKYVGIKRYIKRCRRPRFNAKRADPDMGTPHVTRSGNYPGPYQNPRGKVWDINAGKFVPAPPSITSILRASKAVSLEATQVLYGYNKFSFQDSAVLVGFLTHIGSSQQYLRHIYLECIFLQNSWASPDRWIALLGQVKGLRSIEFESSQFPNSGDIQEFVEHCKPLLASLQAAIEADKLNYSAADVVNIKIVEHDHGVWSDCEGDDCYLENWHSKSKSVAAEMKREIIAQLHLTGG